MNFNLSHIFVLTTIAAMLALATSYYVAVAEVERQKRIQRIHDACRRPRAPAKLTVAELERFAQETKVTDEGLE